MNHSEGDSFILSIPEVWASWIVVALIGGIAIYEGVFMYPILGVWIVVRMFS
jgi:uncharacterized membrane protein